MKKTIPLQRNLLWFLGTSLLLSGQWACEPRDIARNMTRLTKDPMSFIDWGWSEPPMPRFQPLRFNNTSPQISIPPKQPPLIKVKVDRVQRKLIAQAPEGTQCVPLPLQKKDKKFSSKITRSFGEGRQRYLILETDKPLYKPGETVWVRGFEITEKTNDHGSKRDGAVVELRGPRGNVVKRYKTLAKNGIAAASFRLGKEIKGGEYSLHIRYQRTQSKGRKKIFVMAYQPPRMKMKMEFVRKGYGPGDTVEATLRIKKASGEILGNHEVRVEASLSGRVFRRLKTRTNAKGEVLLRVELPKETSAEEGQLTAFVTESGAQESISRGIPLRARRVLVGFFPEGGSLVEGLHNRVYFSIRRKIDKKPQDIEGVLEDKAGNKITEVRSYYDGMGRFVFVPQKKQSYFLRITRPLGMKDRYILPKTTRGVDLTMRWVDDWKTQQTDVQLVVESRKLRRIGVIAMQREQILGHQVFQLKRGAQQIKLPLRAQYRGIMRVTLFDASYKKPLAERLIFRHLERKVKIEILSNRKSYQPRETAHLKIRVTDPEGNPVKNASLGVSVVDDTVLSYADDDEPHALAQRFLTAPLIGKIHKPNRYFRQHNKQRLGALDLVMGTHGWRDFSWKLLKKGQPPQALADLSSAFERPRPHPRRRYRYKNGSGRVYGGGYGRTRRRRYRGSRSKRTKRPSFELYGRGGMSLPLRASGGVSAVPRKRSKSRAFGTRGQGKGGGGAANRRGVLDLLSGGKDEAQKGDGVLREENKPAQKTSRTRLGAAEAERSSGPKMEKKVTPASPTTSTPEPSQDPSPPPIAAVPAEPSSKAKQEPMPSADKEEAKDIPQKRARRRPARRPARRRIPRPPIAGGGLSFSGALTIDNSNDWSIPWYGGRVFPVRFYGSSKKKQKTLQRSDFRETLYWAPMLKTDAWGEAKVSFGLNDNITSFRVLATTIGGGYLGRKTHVIASKRPFFLSVRIPNEVSAKDAMVLPVTLRNDSKEAITLRAKLRISRHFKLLENPFAEEITLQPNEGVTTFLPLRVRAARGTGSVRIMASSKGLSDAIVQKIRIRPRGFPRRVGISGILKTQQTKQFQLKLPQAKEFTNLRTQLRLYTSSMQSMTSAAAGILRQPYGCFEQTSSSNYPNVMVLRYLKRKRVNNPSLYARASRYIARGYRRLVAYEVKGGGFEWFGHTPAHEALTAYGLLQFLAMREVYPVDADLIERTKSWLYSRKDGKGGFKTGRSYGAFGHARRSIHNAYITYALFEAGGQDLEQELSTTQASAKKTGDAYLLALATLATQRAQGAQSGAARSLLKRLRAKQYADGHFSGKLGSFTGSQGRNLSIETTGLAILAMLRAKLSEEAISPSIFWLQKQRGMFGRYGATQATVLSLQALSAFERRFPNQEKSYELLASLNENTFFQQTIDPNKQTSSRNIRTKIPMRAGKNKIKLSLSGKGKIPFGAYASFYVFTPPSAPHAPVQLEIEMSKRRIKLGETTRISATLINQQQTPQAMTMARIAFPGGLVPQIWQLKELKEKKIVDFYELKPRELIVYLRSMGPRERKTIHLDLVAHVTGNYTGPASSAYLYYNDDLKFWQHPLRVSITP